MLLDGIEEMFYQSLVHILLSIVLFRNMLLKYKFYISKMLSINEFFSVNVAELNGRNVLAIISAYLTIHSIVYQHVAEV